MPVLGNELDKAKSDEHHTKSSSYSAKGDWIPDHSLFLLLFLNNLSLIFCQVFSIVIT